MAKRAHRDKTTAMDVDDKRVDVCLDGTDFLLLHYISWI